MSERIFKYPLEVTDEQVVVMPAGAVILCVQLQGPTPCLWAIVNPDAPKTKRRIDTYGTGKTLAEAPGYYIGTYQLHGGGLVFHVFDKR